MLLGSSDFLFLLSVIINVSSCQKVVRRLKNLLTFNDGMVTIDDNFKDNRAIRVVFSSKSSFFIEILYFCPENKAILVYEEDYFNGSSHHDDYIGCSGTDS